MNHRLAIISLLLIMLLAVPVLLQTVHAASISPSVIFQRTWGGSGAEFATCLQRDSSGNLYTAGPTNSFGVGGYDTFILKYDSSGKLLWQRTWGTPNTDDMANPCGMDSSNNLYVAGYTQAAGNDCSAWPGYGNCTVFLLKLDSSGNILWQKDWGGNASNVPHGIIIDSSDNIYVSGYYETSGPGGGIPNAFLLKFNSTGSLLWQKSWGGVRGDSGNGLGTDAMGNIYLTGYTQTFGDGSGDLFVLKIGPDGNILWERAWGLSGFDEGFWVTTDGADNVYLTGRTGSFKTGAGGDVVLLKYNSSGSLQWQRIWGPTGSSQVSSIGGEVILDTAGNLYISGVIETSPVDITTWDLLILEFDSQGNLLHQDAFGALGYDGASGLKLAGAGSIYISGHVSEAPPYNLTALNYTTFTPILGSGTPTIPLQSIAYPITLLNGNMTSATGTSTYGGGMDALLLEYATETPTPTRTPTLPIFLVSLTILPMAAALLYQIRRKKPSSAISKLYSLN